MKINFELKINFEIKIVKFNFVNNLTKYFIFCFTFQLILKNLYSYQNDADRLLKLCEEEELDNTLRNDISVLKNRIVLLSSRAEIGITNVQVKDTFTNNSEKN